MRNAFRLSFLVCCGGIMGMMVGCGGGSSPTAAAPADLPDPAKAVYAFLEAARTGNDANAAALLTPLARNEIGKLGASVAPPGSDTARFELGEVQYLAENGARVPSTWTDLDDRGEPASYRMLWMVRKVPEGWRVAGVAAEVFKGEPPLLLNFEKPEEVVAQQKMLREEIRRRAEQAARQAQQPPNAQDSIQR